MVIINEFSTISGEDFTAFEGAQSSSATEDPVWAPAVSHSFDYIAEEPSTIELSNGIRMPLLGLGTTHSGGYHHNSVVYALRECRYRMIDTAKRYGVERELGLAIKASGVPRSSIFIATKLWPVDFGNSTMAACKKSCERLGVDYLDLYMTHFPDVPYWFGEPRKVREETWRALELLYDDGVIRSIGVSNYSRIDLEELLEYCSVKPHVNQCEFHICYSNDDIVQYCKEEGITFTGYCPLAKGAILGEESIKAVAMKHNKTPAQVCIRWSIQNGVPAIPKSRQMHRILENSEVFDFALDDEDLALLSTLNDPTKKVLKLENLQEKFSLPDGYKLNGQIVPHSENF
uniref:Oxidoreductase n=1 Tax=Ascaris suum TaxID=6253 RepID=F1L8S4_ASCSU